MVTHKYHFFNVIFLIVVVGNLFPDSSSKRLEKENLNLSTTAVEEGVGFFQEGRYEQAISRYDYAIKVYPQNSTAHLRKGDALFKMGSYTEAISFYDKTLALEPNAYEAYYAKGCALREMKNYREALANFDKAISIQPSYTDAIKSRDELKKILAGS